jgi:hypothetical protein
LHGGGVNAMESEFGDGRAPSFCRPPAGRGANDGPVPGVRHIAAAGALQVYQKNHSLR